MRDPVIDKVRQSAERSELVRAVGAVRPDGGRAFALGDVPVRPLYRDEIARLEDQGNTSPDWSRLRVADGFDGRKVRHASFHGDVVLGRFRRSARLCRTSPGRHGPWIGRRSDPRSLLIRSTRSTRVVARPEPML